MIRRVGVLCQDRNSFGFIDGLKRRLECDAELIEPTTGGLAKSSNMTSRQAKLAVLDLQRKGADLIVRFTDADRVRWQDVRRKELGVFPDEVQSILICGVAVDNVEHWLSLDRPYVEEALNLSNTAQMSESELTGTVKTSIPLNRHSDEPASEVTARLVANAPGEVFRSWLERDESLKAFYSDCRSAAAQADCEVPNELERTSNAQ